MKRALLATAMLALSSAGVEQAADTRLINQTMLGHPIQRGQPTLPLRAPVPPIGYGGAPRPQPVRPHDRQRNVIYVPAALPYGYYGPAQPPAQNVSVNVTNVVESPPAIIAVPYAMPVQAPYAAPAGLRLWDADADIAREREGSARAALAPMDPDRSSGKPNAADVNDVKSVDAIIGALYDVLSGPRGTPRNWDRFRTLFADGARLTATVTEPGAAPRASTMSADDYAEMAAPVLERGVFEKEVGRSIDQFGTIAHVFSTYECRRMSGDAKAYQRGINSIQLMKTGDRWWITGIAWESENDANPIPAKYLKR